MAADAYTPYGELIENLGLDSPLFEKGSAYPSYNQLEALLSLAAVAGKSAQSGDVARALDMWIAAELRRAGFAPDAIWPRSVMPRALDPSVLSFIQKMTPAVAEKCCRDLPERYKSTTVSVMGAAYAKQVDVGMATWPSGPEILISTKTMASSFGKNMANRFEEAYGDAKNLKSRHPFAAVGFAFLVHADILNEPGAFAKAVSMLEKLQAERDVYDAVCLMVAAWDDSGARVVRPCAGVPDDLFAERFFSRIVKLTLSHASPDVHMATRKQLGTAL